jgi:hypothetical protein
VPYTRSGNDTPGEDDGVDWHPRLDNCTDFHPGVHFRNDWKEIG